MTSASDRHEDFREALGAFVLGQLDAEPAADVRAHLATCPTCPAELADLEHLVSVLGSVDPDAVRPVGITPPAELDDRIRQALHPRPARGSRRWAPITAAAALAAAAAVVVTTLVVRDDAPAPTVIAVPSVEATSGVTASAGLVDHTWGVEVRLRAAGLPAGQSYRLVVVGDDGRRYDAGGFVGVAGATITCDMSSPVLLDDARSFRVVDASGDEVISGPIGS